MSQQAQSIQNAKPWVLVSTFKETTNIQELERVTPQITTIVDEWQSKGRMMWSGAFDDNKTGMAIFEATEEEATKLFEEYNKICSGVLDCYIYQWDAMPLLSILSNNK